MAAPLKQVVAVVPRPPAGAALPHGIVVGVGATKRTVTLGQTPVDSLESSQSTSSSTSTSQWQLGSNFSPSLETDTEPKLSAETGTKKVAVLM